MVIQMIRICKGEFVFPDPQAAASCLMIVDPDTAALIPAGESGGTKEQRVPQESGRKPVGGEWIFGRRRFVDAFPGLRNPLIRRPSPFAWTGSAGGSQEKEPPGFSNTLAASTRGSQEDIVFLFHFEEGDPSQQALPLAVILSWRAVMGEPEERAAGELDDFADRGLFEHEDGNLHAHIDPSLLSTGNRCGAGRPMNKWGRLHRRASCNLPGRAMRPEDKPALLHPCRSPPSEWIRFRPCVDFACTRMREMRLHPVSFSGSSRRGAAVS